MSSRNIRCESSSSKGTTAPCSCSARRATKAARRTSPSAAPFPSLSASSRACLNNSSVTLTGRFAIVLLINTDKLKVTSVRQLIDEAKKNAKLNREVSIDQVADLSILKEAQKEMGISGR